MKNIESTNRSFMPLILENLTIRLDGRPVISNLNLDLIPGEIGCLLGYSGSGKTTILRAIAGFLPLETGNIYLQGTLVSSPQYRSPPEKRQLGMVFQDLALFPHLTVEANIAFGLHKEAKTKQRERTEELLSLIGLEGYHQRYPHQLSGGQQQRVALARALAPQPRLLMLDEPFSSLDTDLRARLSSEIRAILKQTGTTALLVTHDQHEAFAVADRIAIIEQGRLIQYDTPYTLYHQPKDRFMANFIGESAWLPGQITTNRMVGTELGVFPIPYGYPYSIDAKVEVLLRPEGIKYDAMSSVKAQVKQKVFRGANFLYTLELLSGQLLLALVPSHHAHALGEWIGIALISDHLMVFAKDDR